MVVAMHTHHQQGMTLVELIIAIAIGAILLVSLNSVVHLGLEAQSNGQATNEIAYQGRFALQRMVDQARSLTPKVLTTPAADTTGDWFAPDGCTGTDCVMYCRNTTSNNLIETDVTDTTCSGTTIIVNSVTAFTAQQPAAATVATNPVIILSLTLSNDNTSITLDSSVRMGGGTL